MTNNPRLFRSTLKLYKRGIKVREGRVYLIYKGTIEIRLLNRSFVSFLDILYIFSLSINLLLVKKVYLNSIIKGIFNN